MPYSVSVNRQNEIPNDVRFCSSLSEVKQAVENIIEEYAEMDHSWHKWESLSYLRARDMKNWKMITVGILVPEPAHERTLGAAVSVNYVEKQDMEGIEDE